MELILGQRIGFALLGFIGFAFMVKDYTLVGYTMGRVRLHRFLWSLLFGIGIFLVF